MDRGDGNRGSVGGGRSEGNVVVYAAIGLAIGIGLGLLMDNLSIGVGIGGAVGVAIGADFDSRRRG